MTCPHRLVKGAVKEDLVVEDLDRAHHPESHGAVKSWSKDQDVQSCLVESQIEHGGPPVRIGKLEPLHNVQNDKGS